MPARIYLAPAAAGKTAYVLDAFRDAARDLRCSRRVVVPTGLQVRSWAPPTSTMATVQRIVSSPSCKI